VPGAKIRQRWGRSLAQLPWFLEQADQAAMYGNSGARPRLIDKKQGGTVTVDPAAPGALRKALGLVPQGGV
jgi:predicted ABC-type ATPase